MKIALPQETLKRGHVQTVQSFVFAHNSVRGSHRGMAYAKQTFDTAWREITKQNARRLAER